MHEAVVVAFARTPVGDAFKGSLATTPIVELGKIAIGEALKRSGVAPQDVDDVVMGEVLQGGGDLARYVAIDLGLPADTPGVAMNRQCGSGLQAVNAGAASIMAGMDTVVIAGGLESMSHSVADFIPDSHPETPDAPTRNMGITVGENTADRCGITREEMDEWAYHSHMRAVDAIDGGRFAEEIVPVEVEGGIFDTDEHPRPDTSLEKLAALPAIFKEGGRVTAGNSSSINDGAAALVLTSRDYATIHGLEVLATIKSWACAGVPPRDTGIAPTIAVPRALDRAGLGIGDVKLAEINEAFASMAVACTRELGLSPDIVNVDGGAVGIGHPVAASGARIFGHLVMELRRRGGGHGVASLCAGGGMGIATVVEV
jgi:acetyl-CoA C-acetyltransferase